MIFKRPNKASLQAFPGKLPLLFLLLALPVLYSPVAAAGDAPKKVLIFSSEDPYLPAIVVLNQNIRSTLQNASPVRIQFYTEGLEDSRIANDKYETEFVTLLQRKYEGEPISLIYALSTPALRFLLKHKDALFPNIPIIYDVLDQRQLEGLDLGVNATGVSGKLEMGPTLELALSLQPETRKVVVIAGSAPLNKSLMAQAQLELQPFERRVEISYLTDRTMAEFQRDLAALPPKTIVFYLSILADSAGNNYSGPEALGLLAARSTAPIYGMSQTGIGFGLVGGSLISFEELGRRAGKIGIRVMAGEKPRDIPPQVVPNVAMFDARQLQRWGISDTSLPAGSDVRFRQPTFWEQYKWRILVALAVMILQLALIVWLLFTHIWRKRAERESARFARLAADEHRRLDEVVSNTPGVVWESRSEPGNAMWHIEFVNDYVEEMLGYTVEECRATPDFWPSIMHRDDREESARTIAAIIDGGKEGVGRFRCLTKDGRTIWIDAHMVPVCNDSGEPVGLRGVAMDITDRKRAEDSLKNALDEVSQLKRQLEEENIYLQEEIKLAHNFDEIVGQSDAIRYVHFKIEQVAPTNTTVLISGETGTGKELVARAIHNASERKDRPMVRVNCAALSASLIESELFGHERGSFTGATARKIGRFELADGATIFLDEIGELPLELQSKLLRVIQEGEFERLGSSKTIKVDARIIAATNRNLQSEVQRGRFREDLWYRLNVFPITVPPLRKRAGDVVLLVQHFVRLFSQKLGKEIISVAPDTLKELSGYDWPGNIRELANVIERAVINTHGSNLHHPGQFGIEARAESLVRNKTLEEIEREHITQTLGESGWRIEGPKGAARVLGINPSTLRTRMAKLGIQKPEHTTA